MKNGNSPSTPILQSLKALSHVAIAEAARTRLERPVVHTRGSFYRYGPDGVWRPLAFEQVARVVMSFDGSWCGKKQLEIRDKDIRGVANALSYQLADDTFFDDAPQVVAFENGVVEVAKTGVSVTKHDPKNRVSFILPCKYDPNARASRFRQAVDEWFAGDVDAKEKAQCLQEFAGATILGVTSGYQKALFIPGKGRNGKSVFLNALTKLIDQPLVGSVPLHDLASPYFRAKIARVRLNICAELPDAEVVASEAFKAIVVGDPLECRDPKERPFTARPRCALIFSANNLPRIQDTSEGFWRRLLVVGFNKQFPVNPLVEREILADTAGIATWAIEGAVRLLGKGVYTTPKSSESTVGEWRRESDSVALFVYEHCEPGVGVSTVDKLYSHYKGWSDLTGHKAVASNVFSRRLRALGYEPIDPNAKPTTFRLTTNWQPAT